MLLDVTKINPKSNIAISTLWTRKEYILSKLPEEVKKKINIIGTTYTTYGINFILETLGKNPNIDTLILFGADLSSSGEDLVRLFKKKDFTVKILFKSPDIKEIVDTVQLIDLREEFKKGNYNALIEAINRNFKERGPVRKYIELKIEEKPDLESYPIPLAGHYIYDTSVFRAWVKILDLIMRYGYVKQTEYEEPQKEYLNLMVTIGLYGKEYKIEEEFFEWIKPEDFEKHINEVLNPNKPDGVVYTYGERLFKHRFGKNQIEYLIRKLSTKPYSRRAVVVSWDHEIDQNVDNPPCIILIQGIISGNYYNHIVVIRSNDMFRGWPVNIVGQIELAKYIINEINRRTGMGLKLGTITTISISAHIYKHDWDYAKEVLNKYSSKLYEFVEDPKGYFILYHKENKVVLEHRSYINSNLLAKIESNRFWDIYNFLKNESLYSLHSHAVYLGKELKTAFEKLKKGEKYVQDLA